VTGQDGPSIGVVEARQADLLAGLSQLADLAFGLPSGAAQRSCVLATRLARSLDLPPGEVRAAFYTALLHHVGCVGYAHETARLFGDEHAVNAAAGRTDAASGRDVLATFIPALTRGRSPLDAVRLAFTAATKGAAWGERFTVAACELGRDTARRLGLPADVQNCLLHVYDLWRGGTRPGELSGVDIPIGARIARLAGVAVLFELVGGTDLAVREVRRRAGGMLDADLADRFARDAPEWFADLSGGDARAALLDLEPPPHLVAPDLRVVAGVFADLADVQSPCFLGHSRAVAALAAGAAAHLRMPTAARADLELAGLLHDVGRVAVSTAIWEKPGRLSADEWEQVRLHAYRSERILAGSAALGRLAPLVGRHHERPDGSGYHRGCTVADLSMPARVLAAADAYRTLTEPRPHRPASTPQQAGRRLRERADRGTLDADAVGAVLTAAGHPVPAAARPPTVPLSDREVQVLGLVARGYGNAEIGERLRISRRTAEHHVQHIYTKIGVSSRAAAALYAVEHHLLPDDR
jgi:DNA-binding CsgD family transcriptional regulator